MMTYVSLQNNIKSDINSGVKLCLTDSVINLIFNTAPICQFNSVPLLGCFKTLKFTHVSNLLNPIGKLNLLKQSNVVQFSIYKIEGFV